MVVDVITITGRGASPDDLSITVSLMPLIKSSVPQPHLSSSCPFISDAIYSPRIGSKLTIGFQKSRLLFFLSLSSTSKSTLPLTYGLSLCLTASLPRVKMSASA